MAISAHVAKTHQAGSDKPEPRGDCDLSLDLPPRRSLASARASAPAIVRTYRLIGRSQEATCARSVTLSRSRFAYPPTDVQARNEVHVSKTKQPPRRVVEHRRRWLWRAWISILLVIVCSSVALAAAPVGRDGASEGFEENRGQWPLDVSFRAKTRTFDLYTRKDGLRLALRTRGDEYELLSFTFLDAAPDTVIEGVKKLRLSSEATYIRSGDKPPIRAGSFERVRYRDLYPSIDLELYEAEGNVEFDFLVRPGGDPSSIRMSAGTATALTGNGDLVLRTSCGESFLIHAPVAFSLGGGGARLSIASRFTARVDGSVGIDVGAYDTTTDLVIDPVLDYSTFIAGSNTDAANGVFVDDDRNIYVTGHTKSPDFPTIGTPAFGTLQGKFDAFVMKYDANGTRKFATYLGGVGDDFGLAVTADRGGFVYVTGYASPGYNTSTNTLEFPVTPGAYTSHPYESGGVLGGPDTFVAKLRPDGSSLVYAAMIAGTYLVEPRGIAVDDNGLVTVAGQTISADPFPGSTGKPYPTTVGAYARTSSSSSYTGFAFQLSSTGAALLYSTMLGPFAGVNAAAVDRDGGAIIAGVTDAIDLPVTSDAMWPTFVGGPKPCPFQPCPPHPDAFVAKFTADGRRLKYCTYIRGDSFAENGDDRVMAIAVDPDGNMYLGGRTGSTNFPTNGGAYQQTFGFGFLMKFDATHQLVFSTYLPERVDAIAVNGDAVYVTGSTYSTTFPTVSPTQPSSGGSLDSYVMRIDATGSHAEFSTYLGGMSSDEAKGIAADANGNAYVVGQTSSTNFPITPNAAQSAPVGAEEAFLSKFVFDSDGDGLLDAWETTGIDVDGDGQDELNLAALGATPDHKDLFVEIDYMTASGALAHTHDPRRTPSNTVLATSAIDRVETAFANSPVTNPDGQTGIRLHAFVDEAITEQTPITFLSLVSGFDAIKRGNPVNPCASGHFGRQQDRNSASCEKILKARRLVYRYCLFGHDFTEHIESSGTAESPGNDFIVTLRVRDQAGTDYEGTAQAWANQSGTTFADEWSDLVAATFMHELGHTLGLQHGGPYAGRLPTENCKPNYISIMNYTRQFNNTVTYAGTTAQIRMGRALDYSRSVLPPLNENSLLETPGVGGPATTLVGFGEATTGAYRAAQASGPIDWNGNAVTDTAPVVADINYITDIDDCNNYVPGQTLEGYDDWSHIVYSFRSSRDYADGISRSTVPPTPALTNDEISTTASQRPTIAITAPANGSRLPAGVITVSATASDADGTVVRVEFLEDQTLKDSDTTVPYSLSWTPSNGTHTIRARAVDDDGAIRSAAVVIHVACTTSITPTAASVGAGGGTGSLSITVPAGCTWTASGLPVWVTFSTTAGTDSETLTYEVHENTETVSRSVSIAVNDATFTLTQAAPAPFGAPGNLNAAAMRDPAGRPFLTLSWDPVAGASHYQVEVKRASGAFYNAGTYDRSALVSAEIASDTAYSARVRAVNSSAQTSSYSQPDLATTVFFTYDPIVPGVTTAKAVHITEVRTAVNAVRTLAALPPATWSAMVAPGSLITAAGISELRSALDAALSALGLPALSYTDPTISTGVTRIKGAHVQELRNATK